MRVSPARHHINLRMNVARRLLRETKQSVVDVALDVGYTNPNHFAKLFRREGLSPSDYRRPALTSAWLRVLHQVSRSLAALIQRQSAVPLKKACGARDSVKPGVERSGTPG